MEKIITVRGNVDWSLIVSLLDLEIEQAINKEIIDRYKAAKAALMARVEIKEADITDSIDELEGCESDIKKDIDCFGVRNTEWLEQRLINVGEDIDTLKKIIGGN